MESDRPALLNVLLRNGVAFVVIGGAAIQSHGRIYDTLDIDLVPDTEQDNLARLAAALNELDCRLVTDPADSASWVKLPTDYFTPRSLRGAMVWNLATRYGQLDVTFAPTGFPRGYSDLAPGPDCNVASHGHERPRGFLNDVHESKRQANRPKDRAYLESLDPDVEWRCDPTMRRARARAGRIDG